MPDPLRMVVLQRLQPMTACHPYMCISIVFTKKIKKNRLTGPLFRFLVWPNKSVFLLGLMVNQVSIELAYITCNLHRPLHIVLFSQYLRVQLSHNCILVYLINKFIYFSLFKGVMHNTRNCCDFFFVPSHFKGRSNVSKSIHFGTKITRRIHLKVA